MSLRILITNDDGIDAPGIAIMAEIAAAISDDVWVVAPDGNQSGAGHRFSFGRELALEEHGHRRFAVTGGSPADCVVVGMTHLLADRPADLVLSGVNAGQNLGDIVNCSGTAAGAREGVLQGAIGIAMSQSMDYEVTHSPDWTNASRFGAEVVDAIVAAHRGDDVFYNVNFPFCGVSEVAGLVAVPHQRFSRSPIRHYPSDNAGRFFMAIPETPKPLDPKADFEVLRRGNAITVTPFALQQTHQGALERLGSIELKKAR
ncbi:5'-nucleotidase /3'-nucleotidase /exopolyphosphatase [Devosia lucknowensis]|uniref:5'-nucleotidase SurE n=1 Tax=Devosia lucknowensis TaxID=1096929 RepID=A0A1Y6EMC9_9HYPH|nr:5'/3'-nucleotidase SurE [Devosia lucknowensis]SMQ63805.1 5'-nucleotidase /3'-nucleotidase /exopolyphosphatase [Devosia lucknowensis]